ncbi:MAG TPA: hypothetical protein VK762_32095 [Polyangiaceae bacterium]|jgi:hypothetical protein|nr:hypothetical protein [Polyangiaceae bacterium]
MATTIRGKCVAWFARGALLAGVGGGLTACSQTNDTSASQSPDASRAGALSGTSTVTGKVVSLPVSGSVPACDSGYAHPSVCCEPAPYQSAECVEDSDAPFRSCGHWLTFPDARTCCSLADGKTCTAPMPVSASGSTVPCDLPCGPGGYLPDDPLGDAGPVGMPDCADDPTGFCAACCYGMFSETGSNPTQITPVLCAAIVSSQGGPAICSDGACPDGWQVPPGGQFDVCCRTSDGGASECFSRANAIEPPPVTPVTLPASQPVSLSVVAGNVPACPPGQAHPNVCCSTVPTSACVEYPDTPFVACEPPAPALIYPDPRTCCPLDGSGACSPSPTTPPAGSGECYEPCGPGGAYFAVRDGGADGQCCYGGGLGGGPQVCPTDACDDGPCPAPRCGACPADWSAPLGDSRGFGQRPADVASQELCCQAYDGGGTPQCFSQAERIVTPPLP